MNSFEIILLLLASMVLLGYASWYFKSWKTPLILTGLSLVGLYLSIWFTSQFLTIDEEFFIGEVIHVNNAPFLEWWFTGRVTEGGLSGSFRTSTALMGLLVSIRLFLLREFLSIEQMMMILKLSHWLIVFVAMLASIHIIMDQMIPEKARRASFLPLVYTALLLPTNAFALRIFNHDGISMSLGVLSVMLIVSALLRGMREVRLRLSLWDILQRRRKCRHRPYSFWQSLPTVT